METKDLIQQLSSESDSRSRLSPYYVRGLKWFAAAVFCVAAGVAAIGLKRDVVASASDPHFLIESALALLTALMAVLGAFALSVPGKSESAKLKWIPLVSLAAWTGYVLFHYQHNHGESSSIVQNFLHGYMCTADLVVLGAIPGVFLFLMVRRSAPVSLGWAGVMAAIAAAALAAFGLQFTCTMDGFVHVVLTHFLPVLLIGFLGIAAGRWLLRW